METVPFTPVRVSYWFLVWLHLIHGFLFFILSLTSYWLVGIPIRYTMGMMYAFEVVAVGTHYLGHTRLFSSWFRAHMIGHHTRDYPSHRFLQTQYVPASIDNSIFYFPGSVIVAFWFAVEIQDFSIISIWLIFLMNMIPIILALIITDQLHQAYHVAGSRWEKVWGFDKLRSIHYWHHYGHCKRNYGISSFWLDFLIGTGLV